MNPFSAAVFIFSTEYAYVCALVQIMSMLLKADCAVAATQHALIHMMERPKRILLQLTRFFSNYIKLEDGVEEHIYCPPAAMTILSFGPEQSQFEVKLTRNGEKIALSESSASAGSLPMALNFLHVQVQPPETYSKYQQFLSILHKETKSRPQCTVGFPQCF